MNLIFATSTKKDGSMGLSSNLNLPKSTRNRKRFLRKFGISSSQTVRAQLVHGARIVKVSRVPSSGFISHCDALITNKPNVFLYILTADCFPVFFYDLNNHIISIAHVGWRGLMENIVPKVIDIFKKHFSINVKNIQVVIGPGIQKCHFEIWPETRHRDIGRYLNPYKKFLRRSNKKLFLNLEDIIKYQLLESGVSINSIRSFGECTYHLRNKYFSYRRDANIKYPRGFGNMISIIGFKI